MRVRRRDADGDYVFGRPDAFLVNSPECVGQAVQTRLLLLQGEWFLDKTEGMPWSTQVLGKNSSATYDQAIKERVLDTQGVTGIEDYASVLNATTRKLDVSFKLLTIYGVTTVTQPLAIP